MYCLFSPIQHGAFLSSTYNHGKEKKKKELRSADYLFVCLLTVTPVFSIPFGTCLV